ncbi:MAG: chromosomal replication initiator protein DnaA [Roseibium sp.]|uniref:chromosomal replication initiator protein DnaA n=1 Tax=Roseibium sp. TaxID=1936156 RepID=UPI00262ACC9B|nr:chromosomal replication initiator protein DnaA [Roseibium sp.]MCV0424245.1 chromosomal replication initiator protein DnaA [Roseibium sp.]
MEIQNLTSSDQWERVKEELCKELGEDAFSNWFGRVEHEETAGGAVRLSVPTVFLKNWIQRNYTEQLIGLWKREQKDIDRIEVTVRSVLRPRMPQPTQPPQPITPRRIRGRKQAVNRSIHFGLSPTAVDIPCLADISDEAAVDFLNGAALSSKMTFDTFCDGNSNNHAFRVVRQFATGHEHRLESLYVHASAGIGKTHLLQAAASEARRSGRRAAYMSAEFFMYHLVPALRTAAFPLLHQSLKSIDLLLIDDLQFLHGKQGHEEFCKTLDMVMECPSQVIIAADRPPEDLTTLPQQIQQRLRSSQVVSIQKADFALRHEILKQAVLRARQRYADFDVPNDVADYIARHVTSSIRDLEGALNRLFAHNQLTRQPVTPEFAKKTLRDLVQNEEPRAVKVEEIQQIVCKHFSVSKADLLSSCRARTLVRPRQIAMYIAKAVTGRSLPEIGRRFGNRDHTTVLHAIRKIEALLTRDADLAQEIDLLKRLVHS